MSQDEDDPHRRSVTLSMPYSLSDAQWARVDKVLSSMDGWIAGEPYPTWYGREDEARTLTSSVEPAGLQISGRLEEPLWTGWITTLCARLTLALGVPVHDAEM
jgi:hypothetical protein